MKEARSFTAALCVVVALMCSAGERMVGKGRRGVFSPDGSRIAFEATRNGRLAVGVMPSEGGAVIWVRADNGFAGLPAWTSDGAVVYTYAIVTNTSFKAVRSGSEEDGANLWMWKDGRNVQLTRGRTFDYGASVAKDGTIWFATTRGEEEGTEDRRMCVSHLASLASESGDISIRRRIDIKHNGGVMAPSLSPDGTRLLWSEMRGFRTNWRIVIAPLGDIANDGPKQFVTNPHESSCHSPRWSSDGRMICYTGFGKGDPGWCVYVRDMTSGKTRCICAGENPCFSPDGKALLYDRGERLYIRTLDEKDTSRRPKFEKIAQVDHWDFNRHFDIETKGGVNDILDHVLLTGADTIAWRVNGGSSPRFYSKEESVVDMVPPFNPVRIPDARKIEGHMRLYGGGRGVDTYAYAMGECERRGLGRCAYWPYEENHWHTSKVGAWNFANPQFWCRTKAGQPWIGRTSLAFSEVAAHKLRMLDEILAEGPDTLYIEAWRSGGWSVKDEYVQPNIDAWKMRYPGEGLPEPADPRWIELVAERQYSFFCDVRRHLDASGRKVRFLLGIYCRHGEVDPMYAEKGIDWRRLAENGIIDGVVIMAFDPDPVRPLESTRELYERVAKDKGKCQMFCPVSEYCQTRKWGIADYAKMLGITKGNATKMLVDLAHDAGADGILMECVDYNNYTDEMCRALCMPAPSVTDKTQIHLKPTKTKE